MKQIAGGGQSVVSYETRILMVRNLECCQVDDCHGTFDDGNNYRAFNEGWRFAIAYAVLCVFCLLHFGMQKAGIMKDPVEMDNGVGGGPTGAWATSEVKTTATAPAKKETEAA